VFTRRFILVFLCLFAFFVAVMWAYVTQTGDDLPARMASYDNSGGAGDSAVDRRAGRGGGLSRDPIAARRAARGALRRRLQWRWSDWRRDVQGLAQTLDHAAVRIRIDLTNRPAVQLTAAWYELHAGRPDIAVPLFDRLLSADPSSTPAHAGKAAALLALGRRRQAAETYERLLGLAPHDVAARYNYGALLCRMARRGAAADQFREVVRREPSHVKAWHNLASLAQRDGRLAEARRAWKALLRAAPDAAVGWFNLGIVHLDYGDADEAARCFSYVLMIDPDDIPSRVNLAAAYRAMGDLDAAIGALQRADAAVPCEPTIMRPLAELHRLLAAQRLDAAGDHLDAAALIEEQLAMFDTVASPTAERLAGGGDGSPSD